MADGFNLIEFGVQTYLARDTFVHGERVKNWYAERNRKGSSNPVTLYPTPGTVAWATVGTGVIRGMKKMGGDLYVVVGSECYAIDADKQATKVANISGSRPVHMETDGTHVAILTDVAAYAVNRNEAVTLSLTFLGGVAYQDGITAFVEKESQNIWFSDADDMTTIQGTSLTQKDALADNCVAILMDHRELIIFGETSSEVLWNAGETPVPFVRVPQGFIEHGIKAAHSPAKFGNNAYWLDEDGIVREMANYTPVAISTSGIEQIIDDEPHPEDAKGFIYTQNGHPFYCLMMSTATVCFDIKTRLWHERLSTGHTRWIGQHYARFGDKHLVSRYDSNVICELDLSVFTDQGTYIRRVCEFPEVGGGVSELEHSALMLRFKPGVGLTSGQGSDPKAMLDWSDDGGLTYSNELWAGIGKKGEYKNRCFFNRLGQAHTRRYRVVVTDPVNAILAGAWLSVDLRL